MKRSQDISICKSLPYTTTFQYLLISMIKTLGEGTILLWLKCTVNLMFKRNLSTLHIHLSSIPAQQTHLIGSTIPRNFGQGGGGFSTQVFDGVHNGINLLETFFWDEVFGKVLRVWSDFNLWQLCVGKLALGPNTWDILIYHGICQYCFN